MYDLSDVADLNEIILIKAVNEERQFKAAEAKSKAKGK